MIYYHFLSYQCESDELPRFKKRAVLLSFRDGNYVINTIHEQLINRLAELRIPTKSKFSVELDDNANKQWLALKNANGLTVNKFTAR